MDYETGRTIRYVARMAAIAVAVVLGLAVVSGCVVWSIYLLKREDHWYGILAAIIVPVLAGRYGLIPALRAWRRARAISSDRHRDTP